jgi:2-pyrone-4,6-dicarboxylate lactonase
VPLLRGFILKADPPACSDLTPPSNWKLPFGAVDSHAHVIGTDYIPDRSYEPHPASPEDYINMLEKVGFTYGVLVQVSVHGTDNSLMVETLKKNSRRLRGIAVIKPDVTDKELQMLKGVGVVGVRLNTMTNGGVGLGELTRYSAICAEMGWHVQILTAPDRLEALVKLVAKSPVPVIFDHMGQIHSEDTDSRPKAALLEMVSSGAWVKLSGGFRLTRQGPPYQPTVNFARSLFDAAADRCVWGSDWPHVHFHEPMPKMSALLDLLADWIPDAEGRNKVISTNPRRLYGFE